MIQKILMAILIFGIFPELLGMLITKWTKNEHRIFLNYIYGILIEFAVCEVFAVPLIILRDPFTKLATYWLYTCFILIAISLLLNAFKIKDIFKRFLESLKGTPLTIILVVVLVGLQTFMLVRYCHIDDDDSRFVTYATIAIQQDEMYVNNYWTGTYDEIELSSRDVLSPFPMFTAIVAKYINIHPAIVAHTIFPAILIPLAYMVYWQLGLKLFNDDKNKNCIFMIILSVIYVFGDYSNRANFDFLLFRIWQGKAILANIILPMSWLIYYECAVDNKKINWIALYIVFIAGSLVSSMGIVLAPVSIAVLTIIYMIKYRRLGYGFKSLCAVLPCLIYGFLYMIISNRLE